MTVDIKVFDLADGTQTEYVFIYNEDGSYTSMPKSVWDEQQAKQTQGGLN